MVRAGEKGEAEPAAAVMQEEGSASAQQQPVEPAGASAATASQAEAAGMAASMKELPPADVKGGASSHPTGTPAAGMSKNQMKKLAKQQRSVHCEAWMPPCCHLALRSKPLPQTERLRFSGMLVPSYSAAAAQGAGHVWLQRLQQLKSQPAGISYRARDRQRTLSKGHWSLFRGLHFMHRGLAAICRYEEDLTVKQAVCTQFHAVCNP